MARLRNGVFVLSAAGLLFAAGGLAAVGCVSGTNGTPSAGDDGATPTKSPSPSPSTNDGGTDADALDASDGDADADGDASPTVPAVTMTVLKNSLPVSGVTVIFQDATGAIITSDTTGAAGSTGEVVPSGSQVTVLLGSAQSPALVTITGVEPGDALTAVDISSDEGDPGLLNVTSYPPNAPGALKSFAIHIGSCSKSGVAPASFYLTANCAHSGVFPMLVVGTSSAGGGLHAEAALATVAFAYQKGNTFPDGGSMAMDGGAWTDASTTQTLTMSNVPSSGAYTAIFSEVANGVPYPVTQFLNLSSADGGVASLGFTGHTGYPDFVQHELYVDTAASSMKAVSAIAVRQSAPTAAGSAAIDMSQYLPLMTGASVDTDAGAAQPNVTWTTAAPVTGTDGTIVQVTWDGTNSTGSVTGTWTILAPPSATNVRAPRLPAASDWAPSSSATYTSVPIVMLVDALSVTSYAQMRLFAASLPPSYNLVTAQNGPFVPPLPANDTVRMSAVTYYAP